MADQLYPRSGTLRGLLTDMGDGTHEPRTIAHPPFDLMTDGGDGEYRRLRVDVGQTGFWAGREAFTFHEFSIPTGTSRVIKVVAPINTVVYRFSVELDIAAIRVELVVGGTEGGTFSTPVPVFKTNTMTTASSYTPQVTMAYGGTHTGGTVVDLLTAISGDKLQKSTAATAAEEQPVGFPPGTYYIRLINSDGATASGIFRARWEERP